MHQIDVDGIEPSLTEVLALDRNYGIEPSASVLSFPKPYPRHSSSHDSIVFHLLTVPYHLAKHQLRVRLTESNRLAREITETFQNDHIKRAK